MRSFAFILFSAFAFVYLAFMVPNIVARNQLFEISSVIKGSNESNMMELHSSQKQAYHVKPVINSELISEVASSSDDSLRINVELAQVSQLQHKKIKARRIKSKRLLAAKAAVDHSEERLLMVDQVDYASARTHPPTNPPRN